MKVQSSAPAKEYQTYTLRPISEAGDANFLCQSNGAAEVSSRWYASKQVLTHIPDQWQSGWAYAPVRRFIRHID